MRRPTLVRVERSGGGGCGGPAAPAAGGAATPAAAPAAAWCASGLTPVGRVLELADDADADVCADVDDGRPARDGGAQRKKER